MAQFIIDWAAERFLTFSSALGISSVPDFIDIEFKKVLDPHQRDY